MKFPGCGGKQSYRVTVPKLNGGLNGHDAAEHVDDNQLTDCLNMWWYDGALRTRPGIVPILDSRESLGDQMADFECGGTADVIEINKPVRKRLVAYKVEAGPITPALLTTDYNGMTVKNVIKPNMSFMTYGSSMLLENSGKSYEGMKENGAVAFISPYQLPAGKHWVLGESDDPAGEWVDLDDKIYAPLILVDGRGGDDKASVSGKSYEGFNLLTGAFRCQYTSDGKAYTFMMPLRNLTHNEGEVAVVKGYSVKGKALEWRINPCDESFATSVNSQVVNETDGKQIAVLLNKDAGSIQFLSAMESMTPYPYPSLGITNNIEVKAWKTSGANRRKICNMQFCTWFGGNRSGYNGGTRLFVSGDPEYPNVVRWSDLNNPLYFPENNYVYIGSAGSEVTAFAKQEDKLIIFKRNEMYYTQYVAGQAYTFEDVMNSKVVDVTAAAASFPITPIHPGIGCDCPNTIQLCNNRLVWATTDKKVYALTGSNPFSENNVRELSGNIDRWLKDLTYRNMKDAYSGDYCGHYVLMAGNNLFLFDYKDSGYGSYLEYVSYSKSPSRVPWTRWNIDCGLSLRYIMANGDKMVLCGTIPIGNTTHLIHAVLGEGEDNRVEFVNGSFVTIMTPISSRFQTKTFQFATPESRKDVRRMYIGMTIGDSSDVCATYITEKGEMPDAMHFDAAHFRKTDGYGMIRLTPNAMRIQRFGLRIHSDGAIAVGDMILKYEVYGGGIR